MTSTVVSTDGAILNLDRFEAIRLFAGRLSTGTLVEPPIREEELDELVGHELGFSIVALSGLGRSSEPVRTVVAEAETAGQILAVWKLLRSGRAWTGIDLGRVVATADEGPDLEEPF